MTKKLHDEKNDEFDLDAMFANEKALDITPSHALMTAILEDAGDVQASRERPKVVADVTPWWQRVVQQLGGWQVVSTFATCACFGLYVGYASSFDQMLGLTTSIDTAYVFDSFSVASEFEISFLEG